MSLFSPVIAKAGISFSDQAMLSAFNFALGIFLIKRVEPAQYGHYVLAYSAILLVIGFQNALITTQFTVLAPQKNEAQQQQFCFSLGIGQFAYWLPGSLIVLGAAFLCRSLQLISMDSYLLTAVSSLSVLGVLAREFIRSYYFYQLRPLAVLRTDVAYVLLFALMVVLISGLDLGPLHLSVLAAFGLASFLSALKGYEVLAKGGRLDRQNIVSALQECFVHGKWALGGVIVTWLQSQSYVYLITPLLGAGEMAVAHAGRLLLMPIGLLNMSYGRIFRAQWAKQWHTGNKASVFSSARLALIAIIAFIGCYVGVLTIFRETVISFLFKQTYSSADNYMLIWALFFAVQTARSNASLLLQVFEKFRYLTAVNGLTALITVAGSLVLIPCLGGMGSLLAMVCGEALLALLFSLQVQKWKRQLSQFV